MSTISNPVYVGITLGSHYTSPLTITSSGTIASGADGVVARAGYADAVVINDGAILSTNYGILFHDGGYIDNLGRIQGSAGVLIGTSIGTVVNAGTITGGVTLAAGGTVGNTGLLTGGNQFGGVVELLAGGTVSNGGTMVTSGEFGVALVQAAVVDNTSLIEAAAAAIDSLAGGTVTNTGTLVATGTLGMGNGVQLAAGGIVENAGLIVAPTVGVVIAKSGIVSNSGTIVGSAQGAGIALGSGGTIIDSGVIDGGTGGVAADFGGRGDNLLVLEAGYDIIGVVDASGTDTVELDGSNLSPLVVGFDHLTLSGFTDVLFGTAGYNTLGLSTNGLFEPTISDFILTSDAIDLTAIGTNGAISNQSASKVTVSGSLGSVTLRLDGSDGVSFTTQTDGANGTELVACFLRGTLLMTEHGDVPVESLAIGDNLVTVSGLARSIKWIGQRSYAGRFTRGQKRILPICITAGALSCGVPRRDLWLSPNHALYIDGVLIEVRDLVNGVSILQAETVGRVDYFHIELDDHELLIAEGAAAESFIDDNDRGLFHNAHEYRQLYPVTPAATQRYCAPRLHEGVEVEDVRIRLARRAKRRLAAEGSGSRRESTAQDAYPKLASSLDPASALLKARR